MGSSFNAAMKTLRDEFSKTDYAARGALLAAAALMEKPDIILLDEPTNALDVDGVELIKKLTRRERDRGALVVVSCHDEAIITELSDEIIYLSEGKVVETMDRSEGDEKTVV